MLAICMQLQVYTCPTCRSAIYCSEGCGAQDKPHHNHICVKLVKVQQVGRQSVAKRDVRAWALQLSAWILAADSMVLVAGLGLIKPKHHGASFGGCRQCRVFACLGGCLKLQALWHTQRKPPSMSPCDFSCLLILPASLPVYVLTALSCSQRFTPILPQARSGGSSSSSLTSGGGSSSSAASGRSTGALQQSGLRRLSGLPIITSLLQAPSVPETGPLGHLGAGSAVQTWPDSFATLQDTVEIMT